MEVDQSWVPVWAVWEGFNGGCNTGAQEREVFILGTRVYALPGEGEDSLAPPSG